MMTIKTLLARRGIEFRTRTSDGSEIVLPCPFCNDPRFICSINVVKNKGMCFNSRCGWKSNRADVSLLRTFGLYSYELDHDSASPVKQEDLPVALPEDFCVLKQPAMDWEIKAFEYLQRRGVTPKQILQHRIGTSFVGAHAYRLIVPVYYEKRLYGFTARDITGHRNPKYLIAGAKAIFNLRPNTPKVILLEGVFKALRVDHIKTGLRPCALLGNRMSDLQLELLNKAGCKEVTLWPDPDKDGRLGFISVADKLANAGLDVSVVWPVKEPADDDTQLEQTWKQRRPYSDICRETDATRWRMILNSRRGEVPLADALA